MASGSTETTIERDPAAVWEVVRDFGGIGAWMPGIESCEVDGEDRVIGLMGIKIRERLGTLDEAKRSISYSIVESPLNIEHHEATITVDEDPAGSHVTYDVSVAPEQMLDMMVQSYGQALAALKTKVESS
jgi:carbon monoxide dehydrogenase subunit G